MTFFLSIHHHTISPAIPRYLISSNELSNESCLRDAKLKKGNGATSISISACSSSLPHTIYLPLSLSPLPLTLTCFQHLSQHLKYFIAYFCAVAFSSLCGNLLCNLLANQAERKGGGGGKRKVGKFWCELCYIFCQWLRIFILHFEKRQRPQSRNITSAAGSERSEKREKKEKQREREW